MPFNLKSDIWKLCSIGEDLFTLQRFIYKFIGWLLSLTGFKSLIWLTLFKYYCSLTFSCQIKLMKKPMEKANHLSLVVIQVKVPKKPKRQHTSLGKKWKRCRKKPHYLLTCLERNLYSYALHQVIVELPKGLVLLV